MNERELDSSVNEYKEEYAPRNYIKQLQIILLRLML